MTMLSICYQNMLSGWGFWSKMKPGNSGWRSRGFTDKIHARNAASSSSNSNMKALVGCGRECGRERNTECHGYCHGMSWILSFKHHKHQSSNPVTARKIGIDPWVSLSLLQSTRCLRCQSWAPDDTQGMGLFTRIVGLLAKLAAPILYVPDPLFGIANAMPAIGFAAQRLRGSEFGAWSAYLTGFCAGDSGQLHQLHAAPARDPHCDPWHVIRII